jgi:hypothetical protein
VKLDGRRLRRFVEHLGPPDVQIRAENLRQPFRDRRVLHVAPQPRHFEVPVAWRDEVVRFRHRGFRLDHVFAEVGHLFTGEGIEGADEAVLVKAAELLLGETPFGVDDDLGRAVGWDGELAGLVDVRPG